MKKLTIKSVALGLFLAGYAASSAYALTAKTIGTIEGNAPVFGKASAATAPTVLNDMVAEVTLTKGAGNTGGASVPEIGDTLVLDFQVFDEDGDLDNIAKGSSKNIEVYYKNSSASWVSVPAADITRILGKTSVTISSAMAGATDFGYIVTAETQYGAPDKGAWINVGSLIATTPPTTGTAPTNPTPTTPGTGGGGSGGTITPPAGGIGGSTFKYAIFKTGTYTAADNYSKTGSTLVPKLGDVVDVVVWIDNDGGVPNDAVDGSETPYPVGSGAGQFNNIQWGFIGDDGAANGGTATVTHVTQVDFTAGANGTTFTIPSTNTNAAVPAASAGVAGIQGFNLSVSFDVH